jgi:hypothetical protein
MKEEDFDSYFDMSIKRLETMCFIGESCHPNTRKVWMRNFPVNPDAVMKLESDEWCTANKDAKIVLSVEDNGFDGDGIRLNVDIDDGSFKTSDIPVASIRLSPPQARCLAAALNCIVSMREADK